MIFIKEAIAKKNNFFSIMFYFALFTSSFLLGYYLLGGFQVGFSIPLSYSDDGLFVLVYIKLLLTGHWNLSSSDLGYPFGMNLSDFPGSDFGNRAFFIFLSLFTKDPVIAFNLYAYLSFPITACVAFFVSNKIGLTKINSIALSGLFAFSTFSLQRLIHFGHLNYMCNFVVPIFFYLGYLIYNADFQDLKADLCWKKLTLVFLLLIVLSSFGVYYAFFGCLVIITSGILGSIRFSKLRNFFVSLIVCFIILVGFVINMIPTIINSIENGKNNDIAVRNAGESDIYGLRLTQMLLPHSDHRLKLFRDINKKYSEAFEFTKLNGTASLGVIGSCGFLISILIVLFFSCWNIIDFRIKFFSVVGVVLFLYATVGGFGSTFSFTITPIFRGVNRIGIYISFSSLFVIFLGLQSLIIIKKKSLISFGILFIGLYDQTFKVSSTYHNNNKIAFRNAENCIQKIESLIPDCNKIFQYPYMSYPESPPINLLDSYGLANGFIHSKFTKWNYGAIKGRIPDDFYKVLVDQDFKKQFEIIKKLGFTGIYVDRRGFVDRGLKIEQEIESFFNSKPIIVESDKNVCFFKIAENNLDLSKMNSFEIMKKIDFKVYRDSYGLRFEDKDVFKVDFRKLSIPSFIRAIKGFSVREDWGIWSDALLAPNPEIEFETALPKKFSLILEAKSYIDFLGKPVQFKIGNKIKEIAITQNLAKYEIRFELEENMKKLEIIVPDSISPHEQNFNSNDFRKLGIGIKELTILK